MTVKERICRGRSEQNLQMHEGFVFICLFVLKVIWRKEKENEIKSYHSIRV